MRYPFHMRECDWDEGILIEPLRNGRWQIVVAIPIAPYTLHMGSLETQAQAEAAVWRYIWEGLFIAEPAPLLRTYL